MLKAILVLVTAVFLATDAQRSVATCSLAGRVLDTGTGQPIAAASVWLVQTRGGSGNQTVSTDATGTFSFSGLFPGSFSIHVTADTYLSGAVGKRRPLGEEVWITLPAGDRRDDVTIFMVKAAALSGRVVDEHDKPVANFWVEAWPRLRRPMLGDHLPPVSPAQTDSNGDYRITNVAPGDYVVVAPVPHRTYRQTDPRQSSCGPPMPPPLPGEAAIAEKSSAVPSVPERPVGSLYSELPRGAHEPKPRPDGKRLTYRTLFFPGVPELAEASTITVGPGEARSGLDIQLQPIVATRVSGELTSLQGFSGGGEVHLRLAGDPRANGSEAGTGLQAGSGAFTLLDVPAGSYYLEVTRYAAPAGCDVIVLDPESALTQVKLDVPPSGVDRLVVPLVRGMTITGSVVLDGTSKPPTFLYVYLLPLDFLPDARQPVAQVTDGHLTIEGVLPGFYELHASDDAAWSLESATVGGRDATAVPLVVGPDGVNDLVVTMTDHPSSIRGTVTTSTNQPVADATVVLFSADRPSWPNARIGSLRFQSSRALRGIFDFASVPAGEYFIATVDESLMDPWPSPAFLERTERSATRVTVKQGSAQTIWLKMVR